MALYGVKERERKAKLRFQFDADTDQNAGGYNSLLVDRPNSKPQSPTATMAMLPTARAVRTGDRAKANVRETNRFSCLAKIGLHAARMFQCFFAFQRKA